MDTSRCKVFWLNLLFRGSKSSHGTNYDDPSDEYISLFEQNNLTALNLPILEFSYKNLDGLKCLFKNLPPNTDQEINGLIVTSPRVVEGLSLALQQQEDCMDRSITCRIDKRMVFVVGEKSAKELESKLGLGYNIESTCTGSGKALAHYIETFCDSQHHPCVTRFNLLYPKGNLSDETIENKLRGDSRIKLNSIVIYETKLSSSIECDIVECFEKLNIPVDTVKVIINHTFFSPSGVDSFRQMDANWYRELVKKCLPTQMVQFQYSAIGQTTKAALIRGGFEVFSVAARPNATCLVESLKDKMVKKEFNHE